MAPPAPPAPARTACRGTAAAERSGTAGRVNPGFLPLTTAGMRRARRPQTRQPSTATPQSGEEEAGARMRGVGALRKCEAQAPGSSCVRSHVAAARGGALQHAPALAALLPAAAASRAHLAAVADEQRRAADEVPEQAPDEALQLDRAGAAGGGARTKGSPDQTSQAGKHVGASRGQAEHAVAVVRAQPPGSGSARARAWHGSRQQPSLLSSAGSG